MTLADLLNALLGGLVQALVVVAVVVIHRASGILALAVPFLGLAGATLAFRLGALTPVGLGVGMVVGLALGAAIGAASGLLIERFRPRGWVLSSIATLALAGPLVLVAGNIDGLPFFPPVNERTSSQLDLLRDPGGLLPLADTVVEVGRTALPFGFRHVVAAQLAIVLLTLVAWLLRGPWGTRLRTASAGPNPAAACGVHSPRAAVGAWALAGVLSTGALTSQGLATSAEPLTPILSAAWMVALVLTGWSRPALAAGAATGLTVMAKAWTARGWDDVWLGVALVAVGVVVLTLRSRPTSAGESSHPARDAWQRMRPTRPGRLRPGLVTLAAAAMMGLMLALPIEHVFRVTRVLVLAPLVAALVLVIGWAGVPTFGAIAWAATAMIVLEALQGTVLGFWGAAVVAVLAAAAVAVLLDAAQLRRPDARAMMLSFLASATAGLVVVQLTPGFGPVPRPSLSVIDLADERVHALVIVVVVTMVGAGLATLGQRPTGRLLTLVRDDPSLAATLGRSRVRLRAGALALGGALAGLTGVLAVIGVGIVDSTLVAPESIAVAALAAAIGGLSSVTAIVTGPAWVLGVPVWLDTDLVEEFLRLGGSVLLLYLAPGGLGTVGNRIASGFRRLRSTLDRGRGVGDEPKLAELASAPALATGAWTPPSSVHGRKREVPV